MHQSKDELVKTEKGMMASGLEEGEIRWTPEAWRRVERAPDFVRPGIKKLMVKKARERGYREITSQFLTEIRDESMRLAAQKIKGLGFDELRMEAFDKAKEKLKNAKKAEVIDQIKVFLDQKTSRREEIIQKLEQYIRESSKEGEITWTDEAKARLEKVPSFVREMVKSYLEEQARMRGLKEITPQLMQETHDLLPARFKRTS